MNKTDIEWTDYSWPIANGCRRVSPGCEGCYAERLTATRLRKTEKYRGLAVYGQHGPRWTGLARLWTKDLASPLRLRKPSRIFVADMGDLFFEGNTNEEIAAVFGVMAASPRHTFQVLTKRARRMREWFGWLDDKSFQQHSHGNQDTVIQREAWRLLGDRFPLHEVKGTLKAFPWPLPNVWLGVSAEDQQRADERIPELLRTPAAVRFVSYEPALGPIDLSQVRRFAPDTTGNPLMDAIDWIIVGGESGPRARPFDIAWARSIVEQAKRFDTACFVKQLGSRPHLKAVFYSDGSYAGGVKLPLKDRKGGDMSEWPADIRVRQWPEVRT